MRTTLDLPPDVARTLRLESARRGGRKAASLSMLVADAVRRVYAATPAASARPRLTPGRVIIRATPDAPKLTSEHIQAALFDDSGF